MNGNKAAQVSSFALHCLGWQHLRELADLSEHSSLSSLRSREHRELLIRTGVVHGAFIDNMLVGCSCLVVDTPRAYHLPDGKTMVLPVPNFYLCGSFVLPSVRGCGIGTALYHRRLTMLPSRAGTTVAIEILGTGKPLEVDRDASIGLRFHLAAGFRIVGFSAEPDHGPMLILG